MATKYYGKGKYGASALSTSFGVAGLDEYLAKIKAAGNNIDDACKAAVNAALPIVETDIRAGAERHRKSGDVANAIEVTGAHVEGDTIWGDVGINLDKHPEALHAVYQEYGDGHSPEFPDPFIRPAFDDNKSKIRSAEKAELKKWGVPIE